MCTYSNIGDIGRQLWPNPWQKPYDGSVSTPMPGISQNPFNPPPWAPYNGPTKEQFEEFLQLMRQAKKFDKAMGHPDCEQAEKIQWIKELAEYLGCDVTDLVK